MSESKANEAQIEYWNSKSGQKWVKHQAALDRQIGPHGDAMLSRADAQAGENVLDIGCGCGAVTLDVAGSVGEAGRATGLDISAPMLARAGERASEQGIENATFVQGDAQVQAFEENSFDLAVSRFGVMFFEDPAGAFANIRRALKPAGRLAFICWRAPQDNAWATLPMMEASRFIEMPPPPDPTAPGPFAFADKNRIESILSEAGFAEIEIAPLDIPMALGLSSDLDSAVELMFEIGPLSRLLAEASDEARAGVREAIRALFSKYHTDAGVAMPSAAWIVTAHNPE